MVGDTAEGPVVCVGREEVILAVNENWKSAWTFRCIVEVEC